MIVLSYFQRDDLDEDGDQLFLWHNEDFNQWYLCLEIRFREKTRNCHMYMESTGKKKIRFI